MIVYIAMKQSKRLLTEGRVYIAYVYKDEEKAKAFCDAANKKDTLNYYYVEEEEVQE